MATAVFYKRFLIFILVINTVFWLLSNLLRIEYILSNTESKEEPIFTENETESEIIRKLKSTISELRNQLEQHDHPYSFNNAMTDNKLIATNSVLSPKNSIVFVTGIAGFIGYHVAMKLISMNIKVLGFDDLDPLDDISHTFERIKQLKQSKFSHNILDIIYGNTTDDQHLKYIFNRFEITHILYLIPCNHDSDYDIDFEICTKSLITFLHSILSVYVNDYKHIPFIYGSYYGAINTLMDTVNNKVAMFYHDTYGIPITVLRLHCIYGTYHYTFIRDILNTHKQTQVDVVYISDVVDAILNALNYGYKYAVFDLAKGEYTSQKALLHEMKQHTTHLDDVYIDAHAAFIPKQHEMIDISLAQIYLNYSINTDITTGMEQFMQWYNDDLYERDQYINNRKRNLLLNCFMNPSKLPNLTNYWNKYRQNFKVQSIDAIDGYYSTLQEAIQNRNDLKYLVDIVIFHDGLSWKEQISNPKYNDIIFISIAFDYKYRHFRAYNDARFIWWYQYLKKHKKYYKYVLITDLFDVKFGQDPFHYISNKIGTDTTSLITGTQNNGTTRMKYREYMFKVMQHCYYGGTIWFGRHLSTENRLFNPGSGIAGYADTVSLILQRMVLYEMPYADPMCDANMVQYAKTIHYMDKDKTIHILDTPNWNSRFNANEDYTDRLYVIYHK